MEFAFRQSTQQALSRLGSGVWVSADIRVTTLVRISLLMGSSAAVAVADALLDEGSACGVIPVGHAFALIGDVSAAAAMGRILRRKDVKCFDGYALEVDAAYQAGQRQSVADAFYEARARFPRDNRIHDLQLVALQATGQWRAAKYVLDQRIDAGRADGADLALLVDVLAHEPLKTEATIAWKKRLEDNPNDSVAAFVVGGLAHVDKDYSGSFGLLKIAAKGRVDKTGRLHALQALNAFSLGDIVTAKTELKQALELAPADVDTLWAAAEILRDQDLFMARRSLDIALGLLPHRSKRGVRMQKQRAALLACDGQSQCKGPWRYRPGPAK